MRYKIIISTQGLELNIFKNFKQIMLFTLYQTHALTRNETKSFLKWITLFRNWLRQVLLVLSPILGHLRRIAAITGLAAGAKGVAIAAAVVGGGERGWGVGGGSGTAVAGASCGSCLEQAGVMRQL